MGEIRALMQTGGWVRGVTGPELAAKWGLAPETVNHMAAEASRTLEFVSGDRSTIVAHLRTRLLDIVQDNDKDRVRAIEVYLRHLGELRDKSEVSHREAELSEQDLTEALQKMGYTLMRQAPTMDTTGGEVPQLPEPETRVTGLESRHSQHEEAEIQPDSDGSDDESSR